MRTVNVTLDEGDDFEEGTVMIQVLDGPGRVPPTVVLTDTEAKDVARQILADEIAELRMQIRRLGVRVGDLGIGALLTEVTP